MLATQSERVYIVRLVDDEHRDASLLCNVDPSNPDVLRQGWAKLRPDYADEELYLYLDDGMILTAKEASDLELVASLAAFSYRVRGKFLHLFARPVKLGREDGPRHLITTRPEKGKEKTPSLNGHRKSQSVKDKQPALNQSVMETSFELDSSTVTRVENLNDVKQRLASSVSGLSQSAVENKALVMSSAMDVGESVTDDMIIKSADHDPQGQETDEDQPEEEVEMSDCLWWLPASHPLVRTLEMMTMVIIIASVISFCVETIPEYRLDEDGNERTDDHPVFFWLETSFIIWFTVEYLLRITAAGPGRFRRWMWQPLNLVDLIAILPYYIGLIVGSSGASSVAVIRVLRLSRITRLFKFSRHSEGMQDMVACVSQTKKELVLFVIMTSVTVVLFASAVFYCEKDEDGTEFISIPAAFWWAIATITTVGYGDIFPETIQGRIVGGIAATLGVVLLAIPAGIFISEFMRLHEERKRSTEQGDELEHDVVAQRIYDLLQETADSLEDFRLAYEKRIRSLKTFYEDELASHGKTISKQFETSALVRNDDDTFGVGIRRY